MEWFYADGNERKGPVDDAQLTALIAANTIRRDTLVWNKSFAAWQPAEASGLFAPNPAGTKVCFITGKTFPVSQMIETEHGWVSAEARDTYYQCLREGVPFPVAEGASNARADGSKIVIPVKGGQLPMHCVKTNQAVSAADLKRKKLYWCTPFVFIAILLNLLIVIILYYIFRKKVQLDIPISPEGKRIIRKHAFISIGTALGGVLVVILGAAFTSTSSPAFGGLILLGVLLCLGGLIYAGRKAAALRVAKVKNGEAWLAGACPEFIASLPAYVHKQP